MKKILHIISDTNIGGAGKYLITYCKNRNKNDFEVVVVLPKDSLLINELSKTKVKIIQIEGLKDKSFDIKAISKLKKIFKEEKPDIIHTHASLSARIAAKMLGKIKIIYTKHCDFEPSSKFKYKIFKNINGFLNKLLTDKIIATSERAKENLIYQGIDSNLIVTILNGTDGFKKFDNSTLRKKLNILDNDIVIGYLARIEELKGHKYLIEAFNILVQKYKEKNLKLLLMGTGSYEEEAKTLVMNLNLEDKVIFAGFVKDVESYLNIVDIGINASYLSETTCIALLEAMSLGIPQVATDVGGNPKVIRDNQNGLIVKKADSNALADGIYNLLKDNYYLSLKENCIKIFKEEYTSKIFAEKIEDVYKSL